MLALQLLFDAQGPAVLLLQFLGDGGMGYEPRVAQSGSHTRGHLPGLRDASHLQLPLPPPPAPPSLHAPVAVICKPS